MSSNPAGSIMILTFPKTFKTEFLHGQFLNNLRIIEDILNVLVSKLISTGVPFYLNFVLRECKTRANFITNKIVT